MRVEANKKKLISGSIPWDIMDKFTQFKKDFKCEDAEGKND